MELLKGMHNFIYSHFCSNLHSYQQYEFPLLHKHSDTTHCPSMEAQWCFTVVFTLIALIIHGAKDRHSVIALLECALSYAYSNTFFIFSTNFLFLLKDIWNFFHVLNTKSLLIIHIILYI
jgi:hypothetical protein